MNRTFRKVSQGDSDLFELYEESKSGSNDGTGALSIGKRSPMAFLVRIGTRRRGYSGRISWISGAAGAVATETQDNGEIQKGELQSINSAVRRSWYCVAFAASLLRYLSLIQHPPTFNYIVIIT